MFVEYVLAGLGVGLVFGMFGAGGSAFATPVLAVLGVPGLMAVASPLPAMIPAAFVGARRYVHSGNFDRRVARLAVIGGIPGTLLGALASRIVGGDRLLVLSGLLLFVIGVRLLLPDRAGAPERAADRRGNTSIVIGSAFGVGLLTGLLANGGGFLLVPLFVLVLGLNAVEAAGTSMIVVGILTDPDARHPLGAGAHRLGRRCRVRHRAHPRLGARRPPRSACPGQPAPAWRSGSCWSGSRSGSSSASLAERARSESSLQGRVRAARFERASVGPGRADRWQQGRSGSVARSGGVTVAGSTIQGFAGVPLDEEGFEVGHAAARHALLGGGDALVDDVRSQAGVVVDVQALVELVELSLEVGSAAQVFGHGSINS